MNSGENNSSGTLTFDIGNSRIKWALWHADEIIEQGSAVSSVASMQVLMKQMSGSYQNLEAILAVNVAAEAIACSLQQGVKNNWAKDVRLLRTGALYSGRQRILTNAYSNPAFHGADRWAGLIAASDEFTGALCVISAGTAITLDLLAADGSHLGGRILPSLQTMEKALLADAAAIDVTSLDVLKPVAKDVPALFASDTQGAINSGVYYLLAAGLREACAQASEALSQSPTFIVTGGGAEQLMQLAKMPQMKHRSDLILQGVYLALNKGEPNE